VTSYFITGCYFSGSKI